VQILGISEKAEEFDELGDKFRFKKNFELNMIVGEFKFQFL